MCSSTMVSMHIDNSTICCTVVPEAPLSLAAVLVCCVVHPVALVQEQCRDCGHWTKRRSDRTHRCSDCARQHRQRLQQEASSPAAAAPAPPAPPLFPLPRQKHLSTVERAAIPVLHLQGLTSQSIG